MTSVCNPLEPDDCEIFDMDNFGGQTKATQGFRAYNIQGAELTNMGQSTVLGIIHSDTKKHLNVHSPWF
jgi:hypothetical protein